MDILNILFVVFVWIIGPISGWNYYRKLDEKERTTFRKELRRPYSIYVLIPFVIGYLLFSTGSGLGIIGLSFLGVGFLFFSWSVFCVHKWKSGQENPLKCIAMILLGVSILIAYIYL